MEPIDIENVMFDIMNVICNSNHYYVAFIL